MNYIDEGHVLHSVVHLLASGDYYPDSYRYPPLALHAITLAARVWSLPRRANGLPPIETELSPYPFHYYDIVEPVDLLLLGRLTTLLASLGTVLLTGLVAGELGGAAAAWVAALAAAILPALVIRSATASVDMWATFFATLALYLSLRAVHSGLRLWLVAGAGASVGLAFASKYPAGLVGLPVLLLLLSSPGYRQRIVSGITTITAAALAILAVMPGLVTRPSTVLAGMQAEARWYAGIAIGSFWSQAVSRAEWDQPLASPELGLSLLILAGAGATVGLLKPETRRFFGASILYAVVLGVVLTRFSFRPFRNLLPLVPLACVSLGLLHGLVRDTIGRHSRTRLVAAGLVPLVLLCLFVRPLVSYGLDRVRCVDSRVETIDWLLANATTGNTVALHPDLAFLPHEIARLAGKVSVLQWRTGSSDFLIAPRDISGAPPTLDYSERASFGDADTPNNPGFWRGNRQRIVILEHRRSRSR